MDEALWWKSEVFVTFLLPAARPAASVVNGQQVPQPGEPWGVMRRPPPSNPPSWVRGRPPGHPSAHRTLPGNGMCAPAGPAEPASTHPSLPAHRSARVRAPWAPRGEGRAGRGHRLLPPHPRPGLFTREKCTVFIAVSIRGFLYRLALEIHLANHTKCGLTRHTGRVLNQFRIIEERQVDEHSVGGQDWSRGEADLQQAECRAPALAQRTGGHQAKATDWGRAQKASRRRRGRAHRTGAGALSSARTEGSIHPLRSSRSQ